MQPLPDKVSYLAFPINVDTPATTKPFVETFSVPPIPVSAEPSPENEVAVTTPEALTPPVTSIPPVLVASFLAP